MRAMRAICPIATEVHYTGMETGNLDPEAWSGVTCTGSRLPREGCKYTDLKREKWKENIIRSPLRVLVSVNNYTIRI